VAYIASGRDGLAGLTNAMPSATRRLGVGRGRAHAGGDVTFEALGPARTALRERAVGGCAHEALLAEACRYGAEAGEDAKIVACLVADGLLRE
jgi:hypothetical protein